LTSIELVAGQFHGFARGSIVHELNVSESLRPLIVTKGDSDLFDLSAVLEELLDSPLLGSETKVSNEDSSGFTVSISRVGSSSSSSTAVSTWCLTSEFD